MSCSTVGIVGLGLLGRGITTCLLAHGFDVIGFDVHPEQAIQAEMHIESALQNLSQRGRLKSTLVDHWQEKYQRAASLQELAECQFVIESVIEDLSVKQVLLAELETIVGAEVPIASNTSALPISLLQQVAKHPERIIGMHWAEPCHLTQFLEVIQGAQTNEQTIQQTLELGKSVGKQPCLVQRDVRGFIVNRLAYAMYREAFWLLENEVADVATIDRAFQTAMSVWANIAGPFRWMDLTGLPAYAAVMQDLFPELSQATEVPEQMRRLVASGAQGIANGRGFYSYTPEEARQWEQRWQENVWAVQELQAQLFPEADHPISEA